MKGTQMQEWNLKGCKIFNKAGFEKNCYINIPIARDFSRTVWEIEMIV
jgi:hypothetical protein